jgi:FkbM family methyltransferase
VVLDCGANVGVHTREALERGAKLVVAIEPAPERMALCLCHQPGDPADVQAAVARAYNGYRLEVACISSDAKIGPEVGFFF